MEFSLLLESLYKLNRYHSSPGMCASIDLLTQNYGGTRETISDPLGTSWSIPPYYKVNSAKITNSSGKVLASYEDNPLFLNAYSESISLTSTLADLRQYIVTDIDRPDDFIFSFRRQYRHWEKGWGISLPYNTLSSISDDELLSVSIDTEFSSSPLSQYVLGEYKDRHNVVLVAHLDHPGQVNDGLSACLCINEVFQAVTPFLRTINLVCLNSVEIVGTVLHLKKNALTSERVEFALNVNGISIDSPLVACQSTVDAPNMFDMCISLFNKLGLWNFSSLLGFREGWGNDEIAFHIPGVKIPCASIYRSPFPSYHTSSDDLRSFSRMAFEDSMNLISSALYILDNNLVLDKVLFDHLPCLSSPELGLYLEPSLISGLGNSDEVEKSFSNSSELPGEKNSVPEFLSLYMLKELDYINAHDKFPNLFMNQVLSLMCNCAGLSLIELCSKLSAPPLFTLNYLKRMQSKGLITLSSAPRLRLVL